MNNINKLLLAIDQINKGNISKDKEQSLLDEAVR